jgi:bifunctional non-homologous end joining protein LigD
LASGAKRTSARGGAPVAAPLEWKELEDPRLRPDHYTIRNIFDRLRRRGDIWKDLTDHAQALPHKRVH